MGDATSLRGEETRPFIMISIMKHITPFVNSLLVLQKFTTARKSGNIIFTYKSFFSSDTHQSMKTSDSNLKVNRNPITLTASGYIFRLTFRSLSDVFTL